MSTPASLSGAATSRTASVVSSPNGSGPSISGTRRGHGDGDDLDARVVRVDELLVAAARDRRLGREQADPPVARRERRGVRLGLEDADDGHGERALEVGEPRRGRACCRRRR